MSERTIYRTDVEQGAFLRRRREQEGLTPEEIAARSDMLTVQDVLRAEEHGPRAAQITVRMAAAYRVDFDEIFFRDDLSSVEWLRVHRDRLATYEETQAYYAGHWTYDPEDGLSEEEWELKRRRRLARTARLIAEQREIVERLAAEVARELDAKDVRTPERAAAASAVSLPATSISLR